MVKGKYIFMKRCSDEKHKKKKKYSWLILLVASYILIMMSIIFWEMGGHELFVITKTNFSSYEKFKKKAISNFFQEKAPESGENIEYYYSQGHNDEFVAVAYDLNDEDYLDLQEYYQNWFERGGFPLMYQNSEIPDFIYDDENLNFLEDMAGEDLQNMQILVGCENITSNEILFWGVLGNPNTGRVIVLSYEDSDFLFKDDFVKEYIEQQENVRDF